MNLLGLSRDLALPPIREGILALLSDPVSTDPGLFGLTVEQLEPSLKMASDIDDYELGCLYTFADYFSFCRAHGDTQIATRTPAEEEAILRRALSYLNGETAVMPAEVFEAGVID